MPTKTRPCRGPKARTDSILGTDKVHTDRQRLAGQDGAPDLRIGRLV